MAAFRSSNEYSNSEEMIGERLSIFAGDSFEERHRSTPYINGDLISLDVKKLSNYIMSEIYDVGGWNLRCFPTLVSQYFDFMAAFSIFSGDRFSSGPVNVTAACYV